MMTREEVEVTLKQARKFGGYGLDPFFESFLIHDQAQRALIAEQEAKTHELERIISAMSVANTKLDTQIEQQAKEIEQWKAAAQMHNGVYEPLQQENKTLREALQALLTGKCGELLAERAPYSYKQAQHALNNEHAPAKLGKETQVLREALQLLYDCQNGCPLPKYETDWNRAMELAQRALKEVL